MTNFNIPDPPDDKSNPWSGPDTDHSITTLLSEWGSEKRDIATKQTARDLAQVNKDAAAVAAGLSTQAADRLAQSGTIGSIVSAYIQVAEGSLDRAVSRGQYITTAAGAIVTAYTTLLGVTYSSSSKITEIHPTALIPPVFLGTAIAFAVAYIAFLKQSAVPRSQSLLAFNDRLFFEGDSDNARALDARLKEFCEWTYGGVRDRSGYLHMSVYALAIGVAVLPISFLNIPGNDGWLIFAAGVAILASAAVILLMKSKSGPAQEP